MSYTFFWILYKKGVNSISNGIFFRIRGFLDPDSVKLEINWYKDPHIWLDGGGETGEGLKDDEDDEDKDDLSSSFKDKLKWTDSLKV